MVSIHCSVQCVVHIVRGIYLLKYNKNERGKWIPHRFLRNWLNRCPICWCQFLKMDVPHVVMFLDFANSPRGTCPSHL